MAFLKPWIAAAALAFCLLGAMVVFGAGAADGPFRD
jgi:hypothetical protein